MTLFKLLTIDLIFALGLLHSQLSMARTCDAIHLPYDNNNAYLFLDHHINGEPSYLSDSMSNLQRLNPVYSDIFYVGTDLVSKVAEQGKLKVIKNPEPYSDQLAIVSGAFQGGSSFRFSIGKKVLLTADKTVIRNKLEHSLYITMTHGISLKGRTQQNAKIRAIFKVTGKRNADFEFVSFKEPLIFESEFIESSATENQRMNFLWSKFKTKDGIILNSADFMVNEMFFEVQALNATTTSLTLFLDGPLFIEQFPVSSNPTKANSEIFWEGMGIEKSIADNGPKSKPQFLHAIVSEAFKNKIYANLHNKEYEKEALQMYRTGKLKDYLEAMGYSYEPVQYKLEMAFDQFKFFNLLKNKKIPIETGIFGEYHGTESHALQLYCVTKGMSKSELDYYMNFYQEMGHNAAFGWKLWNALFDYPRPDSPRSPLYWAKKMREIRN